MAELVNALVIRTKGPRFESRQGLLRATFAAFSNRDLLVRLPVFILDFQILPWIIPTEGSGGNSRIENENRYKKNNSITAE